MKNPVRSTSQLADALGLSRWTVSRALNGHKGIHAETAERIRLAARDHGFSPSILGRSLRTGKTDLVGVCVPDLVDYFLTDKVMHLQKAVSARGLDVLLQISDGTPESENAALERFAAMRCRGVVVVAPQLSPDAPGWRNLAAADIPVVRVDSLAPARGTNVETHRAAGLLQVVEHLHGLGHREIAAVDIFPDTVYARQRIDGLVAGARAVGWNPGKQLHYWHPPDGDGTWKAFESHPVTALVAVNDRIALRLIRWADCQGLRVPEDLSIVGFDNAEIAAISRPSLTTVDPRPDLLIERAVRFLFETKTRHARIKPQLVIRESTGPAPRKRKTRHV